MAHLITDLIEGDEDAQVYADVEDLRYADSDDDADLLLEDEVGRGAEELGEVTSAGGGVGKDKKGKNRD